MDAKKFAKMLQAVVKEAVRDVVRNELRQVIREEISGKQVVESARTTFNKPKPVPAKLAPKFNKPAKQFSKDPFLNDILNETSAFSHSEAYGTGTAMPSLAMDDFGGDFAVDEKPSVLRGINGEVVEVTSEQTQAVVEAMTRDYSALMAAINKKKGN
jgi:hypothetical protein